MSALFELALRDKRHSHKKAAKLSWEEKVASVERMQKAAYIIRKSTSNTVLPRTPNKSVSKGVVRDTSLHRA